MKERWKIIKNDVKKVSVLMVVFFAYLFVGRHFLYSLCPMVMITGFPCPGCGMTRAMFAFLRGDFVAAWKLHPFLYVLIFYVVCLGIRRYVLLKECKRYGSYLLWIFAAMFLFYIYRMIRYFPGNPPMSYYYGSWIFRIWNQFH